MKPNLGIIESNLQMAADELNKLLADEIMLYFQTRNHHWNIEGQNFNQLHAFYESQFNELDDIMDRTAERIRVIGHYSQARLSDCIRLTSLSEPPFSNQQTEQLQQLLVSHETIIRSLRRLVPVFTDDYQDIGTADFITQLLSLHETMAWKIRAFI
jgi:starvation-inducible DNA-binding protein